MFIFTLFFSLLAGLLTPYAHPIPAAASETSNHVAEVSSDRIAWSASRRLNWEDFRAKPEDGNPHHAMTAANLAVDAGCKNNKFFYEVKCVFLPGESWSKNKQSEKLLAHEQLHFDLTEVHARMLRKQLQGIGNSCGNLKSQLNTTVGAAFKAWKTEQERFDKLSRHGLDKEVQLEWAASIADRLQELEAWQ